MIQLIQRNWNSRQQVAGETLMKYTIQRDGRLTGVEVERSSGYFALDQTSQRALLMTRQLPPLPAQFTEPTLTVHLIFRYER
jgi:TonB family protein